VYRRGKYSEGTGYCVLENLSDAELMELVAKNDLTALRVLYRRYERLAFALSKKIVGSSQEAEEVVQDVFMKIWNKGHTFNSNKSSKFSSWLLRICQNTALDTLRKKSNATYTPLDTLANILDSSINLDNELEMRLIKNRLREKLNELPNEQREVIELMYFEGLSQAEIAEGMGIPLGTVKSRARLAMAKLRQSLKGKGSERRGEKEWQC
jgi:RNA polymerase sigma-70 factor (family 1)